MAKFKNYIQDQIMLLPPNIGDKIDDNHIARFISMAIDKMSLAEIESSYSELGCRAYSPRMLLKVLLYGYSIGIRSSRKLQQKIREDIVFMWLAGMQDPDFRTISDFRKLKLLNVKDLFRQVLEMCKELGMVKCGKVAIDGTKIEANCGRNKITYRKNIERRKQTLEEQIDLIFEEVEAIDQEEDKLYGEKDGYSLDRVYTEEEIKNALEKIKKKKQTTENKLKKKKIAKLVVEEKLKKLGDSRNSYGITDNDATLMQMKEGYLAPGYNVQIATENQVILGYGVYQNRTDVHLLEEMVNEVENNLGYTPENIIADKGYASEKNYDYLETKKINCVIPHSMYDYDKRAIKQGIYKPSNNHNYRRHIEKIMNYLETKEGKEMLSSRKQDVEPTFGDIKYNMNFRKLLLRYIPKANIEVGLISIAHNIKKLRSYCKVTKLNPIYT